MKELILKIKSLKLDDGTFRSIGNDKAIDKVLNLILEQENKTFDPKDLGFKESRKSCYEKKLKDGFECDLIKFDGENEWTFSYYLEGQSLDPIYILILKIKNHRQGEELLQSLGVIE